MYHPISTRLRERTIERFLRDVNKYHCTICYRDYDPSIGFTPVQNPCKKHEVIFNRNIYFSSSAFYKSICKYCFEKCLLNQANQLTSLSCPICYYTNIDLAQLRPLLQKSVIDQLEEQLSSNKIKEYPLKWCPVPNCGYGVTVEDNECQSYTCPDHGSFCSSCHLPDHHGRKCLTMIRELRALDQNENEFYEWLQQELERTKDQEWGEHDSIKPCPHCQIPIFKNGGCPSIICINCGHYFRWDDEPNQHIYHSKLTKSDRTRIQKKVKNHLQPPRKRAKKK